MARLSDSGEVAVVSPSLEVARDAASRLAPLFRNARLVPLSMARFLRRDPLPVIFAPPGEDPAEDRMFLTAARERLLWKAPPRDLYEAISGVVTTLAPRRSPTGRTAPGGQFRTALLLEGRIDGARAALALASPARDWIVEHPGMVRISARGMASLKARGVRWLALSPVRFLGVAGATGAARSVLPRGVKVWRLSSPSSRARGGRPSPK